MTVKFIEKISGPERLVCEAEVVFEGEQYGPLNGLKLVGFCVWRGADGGHYVTVPSRAFGAGTDRRYFDFLRSTDGSAEASRQFKAWMVEQFEAAQVGA